MFIHSHTDDEPENHLKGLWQYVVPQSLGHPATRGKAEKAAFHVNLTQLTPASMFFKVSDSHYDYFLRTQRRLTGFPSMIFQFRMYKSRNYH